MACSTLETNRSVEKDKPIYRIIAIPLVIEKSTIEQIESISKKYPYIPKVLPFRKLKVGMVITVKEVNEGRIQDQFVLVVQKNLSVIFLPASIRGKKHQKKCKGHASHIQVILILVFHSNRLQASLNQAT